MALCTSNAFETKDAKVPMAVVVAGETEKKSAATRIAKSCAWEFKPGDAKGSIQPFECFLSLLLIEVLAYLGV